MLELYVFSIILLISFCSLTSNNRGKPAEGGRKRHFARVHQMNGIDYNTYWSKRSSWKQPIYYYNKKSHEALEKLKGILILHVASYGKWQSYYKIPGNSHHYYLTTQKELYREKSSILLKYFISIVSCHNFSNLF